MYHDKGSFWLMLVRSTCQALPCTSQRQDRMVCAQNKPYTQRTGRRFRTRLYRFTAYVGSAPHQGHPQWPFSDRLAE